MKTNKKISVDEFLKKGIVEKLASKAKSLGIDAKIVLNFPNNEKTSFGKKPSKKNVF